MTPRILIVDDNGASRAALGRLLRQEGFDVHICATGLDVLACLQEGIYHALVTDYEMPDMNGVELLQAVRERSMGLRAVIVSGCAAHEGSPENVPWFDKPVSLQVLVAALRPLPASGKRGATPLARRLREGPLLRLCRRPNSSCWSGHTHGPRRK